MCLKFRFDNIAAILCLAAFSASTYAGEASLNLEFPSPAYTASSFSSNSPPLMVALNEVNDVKDQNAIPSSSKAEFEPSFFTGSNLHKYLGLGTVALAIATAVAPKPPEIEDRLPTPAEVSAQDSSTHAKLGRATATMAAATVASGLITHWGDFHLEDGITDPDNLHALLGAAGALAIMYAVSKAPDEGHAGKGIFGGIAMGVAVKLTW